MATKRRHVGTVTPTGKFSRELFTATVVKMKDVPASTAIEFAGKRYQLLSAVVRTITGHAVTGLQVRPISNEQ